MFLEVAPIYKGIFRVIATNFMNNGADYMVSISGRSYSVSSAKEATRRPFRRSTSP